jgi:hypothetical protein
VEATAITYRTGESRSKLRTVLLSDVRDSVVLLPAGRMDVMVGKLLHGSGSCAHKFWAEVLGTDPDSDGFAVPAAQVVRRREVAIAVRVKRHK